MGHDLGEESGVSLTDSVQAGLDRLAPLDVRDRAVAELVLKYAKAIDDTAAWSDRQRDPLAELGPKLLAGLQQLGMTPAARKAAVAGEPPAAPKADESPLEKLRRERAERAGQAKAT
jgi:hypothetical protein